MEVLHFKVTKCIHTFNQDTIELLKFFWEPIIFKPVLMVCSRLKFQLMTKALICGHWDALQLSFLSKLQFFQENMIMINFWRFLSFVVFLHRIWSSTLLIVTDFSTSIINNSDLISKAFKNSYWLKYHQSSTTKLKSHKDIIHSKTLVSY